MLRKVLKRPRVWIVSMRIHNIVLGCFIATATNFFTEACAELDLEAYDQGIVLDTKRIIVAQYPSAFNPSLVRWRNSLLLSFRVIPDARKPFHSWIGLVWLDDAFNPRGCPQRLHMRKLSSKVPSRLDDARLITIQDRLYLVYSDNDEEKLSKRGFRMHIAQVHYENNKFFLKSIEKLTSFEGSSKDQREKNWVPFNYSDELLCAYSIAPHKILYPLLGTGHCELFSLDDTPCPWEWGELRGGTPALLDSTEYLAFFHSSKKMKTTHSHGKDILHYFMGAYTFQAQPPFALTRISPQPIVGKKFYQGGEYQYYWKPVKVVFPCGLVIDNDYLWVSYGRDDHEMWVAQLDKKKLYESLMVIH